MLLMFVLPIVFMLIGLVVSMLLETVSPKGLEIGESNADSAGLILRSWMLPAGLLMLRMEAM